MNARRLPWIVMGVVLVVALAIGTGASDDRTDEDQVRAIAATIACPQCSGQSSATSDAPAAVAIRADVAKRLARGQSPDEIRDYYASRFGESILLNPGRSGAAGVVWALPVIAVVVAFAGLAFAFRRWQAMPDTTSTDEDRDLVAQARESFHADALAPADAHGEGSGR